MKVVFDMDTGVDDSLALIYALNRPAYEIQGIGVFTEMWSHGWQQKIP